MSLDMDAAARGVRRSQVLTVHGAADETIPVADAHAYAVREGGSSSHFWSGHTTYPYLQLQACSVKCRRAAWPA